MKRSNQASLAFGILMLFAVAFAPASEAGGFWKRRTFRSSPTRSVTVPNWSYSSSKGVRQMTTRSRSDNWQPNRWPGAIGNPPPRYQFFQDINGYWR
ncbi:hypothetical protein [Rhodopirellula sp. MGV]|uniref:hypothetical protein n=1 Tax=Rhodopirellula sp. MGV TaxID=2023130 RepID=UPI000B9720E7|nr:hypothetical protein [Rhodopirellula sp. MGV]OYP38228.1 hypothetical protein CGZ80_03135 [Rhodopirellula sp. MGV]PNY38563.1 hypothetical protein C2E31_01180 [Rhodopirellula baltica]